jgi:hypothetical protein
MQVKALQQADPPFKESYEDSETLKKKGLGPHSSGVSQNKMKKLLF